MCVWVCGCVGVCVCVCVCGWVGVGGWAGGRACVRACVRVCVSLSEDMSPYYVMVNQLRYSREELFSLKNVKPSTHTRLPDPLYHCLLNNGIAHKPRGCRGGDSDRTKHARVVISNRYSNVKQAFNYNGRFRAPTLIHIPVTTDCVAREHSKFALKGL